MAATAASKTTGTTKPKPSAKAQERLAMRLVPTGLAVPKAVGKKERFLDVRISDKEVAMLYQLIEYDGIPNIAKAIGVCDVTVLRICAGMFDKCKPATKHLVRRFFAETA